MNSFRSDESNPSPKFFPNVFLEKETFDLVEKLRVSPIPSRPLKVIYTLCNATRTINPAGFESSESPRLDFPISLKIKLFILAPRGPGVCRDFLKAGFLFSSKLAPKTLKLESVPAVIQRPTISPPISRSNKFWGNLLSLQRPRALAGREAVTHSLDR